LVESVYERIYICIVGNPPKLMIFRHLRGQRLTNNNSTWK